MGHYISPIAGYYEGDQHSLGDLPVPPRPDATYEWVDSAWLQSVAVAQVEQIAKINSACEAALGAITLPYPPSEILTWDQQLAEAVAFLASNSAATPLLTAISQTNGKTVAALSASIVALSANYKAATGAIIGQRQALTDKISSATTIAEVLAISWA